MLWLPKWLRQDQAPTEPENPSRRTFIQLASAAAMAALAPPLPDPLVAGVDYGFGESHGLLALIDDGTYRTSYLLMHRETARVYNELLKGDPRYALTAGRRGGKTNMLREVMEDLTNAVASEVAPERPRTWLDIDRRP